MPELYRVKDRHLIEVHGPGRVQWLHNLCTNDILLLATGRRGDSFNKGERVRLEKTPAGRGCYAAMCNRQGKMVAEFKARLFENHIQLETGEPTLLDTLQKHVIMEEVTLEPREAPIYQMFGVDLPKVPLYWFGTEVSDRFILSPTIFGADYVGEFVELESTISEAEYERRRIEAGWPRWGVDMDSTVLPMEAGLEPIAISYTKGCYLGQEVIQRVKTYSDVPRQLVSLEVRGIAAPGSPILADGREIGRVTSACADHALGYVRKEYRAPGTTVTIAPDGASATVRGLPWQRLAS